ncbi:MAG TPA: GerMN domain-containing protein [Candidatus Obscuribacterales bacterium]
MSFNFQSFVKTVVLNMMLPALCIFLAATTAGCTKRTVLTSYGGGAPHSEVRGDILGSSVEVWFVKPSPSGLELVSVKRRAGGADRLSLAVNELLRGPTPEEEQAGLASEIPKGTILLAVRPLDDDYEIDLSRRFASGGGSSSMETRIEQLRRTVAKVVGTKRVFLNVEGQRLLTAAGEGLEIKQPINPM